MDILIRNVDIRTDIQGIREVHGDDDHWGSDEACFSSTKSSLENGFFIQVAVFGDRIVGHTEWVISDEPKHKFLYLGIMWIHKDYQKKGIGTKLLKSGVEYARANDCLFLRTMPETETGSNVFYEKCGFVYTKDSNSTLKIATTAASPNNAVRINKVPFSVVKSLPFMVGLYQHASAHIWKCYNVRDEYNKRIVAAYKIGGAYINIDAFNPTDCASVGCWSEELSPALIAEILAVGGSLGYKHLNFCVLSKNAPYFHSFDYEISDEKDDDDFMEREL
jgi:GNAT superfamily N-acetyltransferase